MKIQTMAQIIITGCLMISVLYAGTTGKLAGRVLDAETEEPIPGTNIYSEGTTLGAMLNIEGYFFRNSN